MYINIDVKEELCFGEEITEVTDLKQVIVNITRSSPACDTITLSLNVSYNKSGMDSVCKHKQLSFTSA